MNAPIYMDRCVCKCDVIVIEVRELRIEQLNFILEIFRQNSMRAAAEHLFITPQALSSAVKSVEEELNIQIFRRSNKGISLTKDGKEFIEFAESTMHNYHYFLDKINGVTLEQSELNGQLTLYVAPIFYELILPMYVGKFKRQYPNISLAIVQRSVRGTITTMTQNMNDEAIGALVVPVSSKGCVPGFLPEDLEAFSFKILNRNQYLACVPEDSPLASQKSVSLKKLLEYPLVDYGAGDVGSSSIVSLLKEFQPNLKISMSMSSFHVWAQAIKDHMGIGVMNAMFSDPDFFAHDALNNLTLLKLNEAPVTYNCFVYSKNPATCVTAFLSQFPDYKPKKNDLITRFVACT